MAGTTHNDGRAIVDALKVINDSLAAGITTTIAAGDIEIGAVELKNSADDTRGTVKAASTAAVATDTALVVALSPNNTPIGAGTEAGAMRVTLPTNGTGRLATLDTLTSGNVGGFTTLVQSTVVMSVAGAYATGDYMGTTTSPQSFAGTVRVSGGTGVIKSILISDKITTANVAMELWIIDRTYTAPTDNAAWDLTDANMLFVQGIIPISTVGWYASSAGQVYFDGSLSIPVKSNGTTLFYALVARGTTPAFTSTDLTITLGILQD